MPRPNPSGTLSLHSPRNTVGHMSYEELFAVVTKLRGIRGPARVKAIAAANTWTIGPLEVDLMVTPLSASPPD
jgi:hypothetical protein